MRVESSPPITPAPVARYRLGNVPASDVTFAGAIERIAAWRGREPFRLLITFNVDNAMQYQQIADYRAAYDAAALCMIDGTPVLWAARWLGLPQREKVAGSDMLPVIFERANREGWRVFFCGGHTPEEMHLCLDRLRERYPSVTLGGHYPPFGFERDGAESARMLEAIRSFGPDLLLLGTGAPKAEVWMARHAAQIGRGVGMGIGAGLRMLVGIDKRAPRWMQRAGLEWAWRLAGDPVRLWKRYLVRDVQFIPLVLRWKWAARGRKPLPMEAPGD